MGGSDEDVEETSKKRQRAPQVCQNCRQKKRKCDKQRPKCAYCMKTRADCVYDSQAHVPEPEIARKGYVPKINTNSHRVNKPEVDALLKELARLKAKLAKRESPDREPYRSSNSAYDGISVNFHEGYNSLAMKKSGHEDYKPLDFTAMSGKDPYLMFFSFYVVMILKVNGDVHREQWKSRGADTPSKWMLLIDTANKDKDLGDATALLNSDRHKLFKSNSLPLISSTSSNNDDLDNLKRQIEAVLPHQELSIDYLDHFFKYIWPSRPWVNEASFKEQIWDIIRYDPITLRPKINLTRRFDLSVVATFLIILRYTSVTIQVMKSYDPSNLKLQTLRTCPIPVEVISAAQLALSSYRVARKTSLEIVAALLYLRIYFRDCPEDGDSIRLAQSQNLYGLIVQSAVSVGLNRDPVNYAQTRDDLPLSNLRRRIWYSIISIDARTSILSGSLTTLPDRSFWNVKFPVLSSNDDLLEKAQLDEVQNKFKLDEIYLSISKLINDVNQDTNLQALMALVDEADAYIGSNYNMNGMVSTKNLIVGTILFQSLAYRNTMILTTNLVHLLLKLHIHGSISLFAQSNSHLNPALYEDQLKKMFAIIRSIYDLAVGYLLGQFKDFVQDNYDFEVLPLIGACFLRTTFISISTLLRLYHAVDLFENTDLENKIGADYLQELITVIIRPIEYLIPLYKQFIAKKYYSGLKLLASARYGIAVLKNYKFQSISKIIKFFKANNNRPFYNERVDFVDRVFNVNALLLKLSKGWSQLATKAGDGSAAAIIHNKTSNLFSSHISRPLVNELVMILQGPYIFCPEFPTLVADFPSDSAPIDSSDRVSKIISDAFSIFNKKIDTELSTSVFTDTFDQEILSSLDTQSSVDEDFTGLNAFLQELDQSGSLSKDFSRLFG